MLFFNELICITSRKWRSRLVHWRRKIVMIVMLSFFTPSRFGCNFRLIGRLVEFAKMRLNTKCSWRWCRPWLISSTHQNRLDNFHTNVVCYNIYFLHHMNKHNICFLQNCDRPHSSFHIAIERPSFNANSFMSCEDMMITLLYEVCMYCIWKSQDAFWFIYVKYAAIKLHVMVKQVMFALILSHLNVQDNFADYVCLIIKTAVMKINSICN